MFPFLYKTKEQNKTSLLRQKSVNMDSKTVFQKHDDVTSNIQSKM